jgi:hypothetical protein
VAFIGPLYLRETPCPGTDWTLVTEELPPPHHSGIARVYLRHREGGVVRGATCWTQEALGQEQQRLAGPVLHPPKSDYAPRDFRCPKCNNVERNGLVGKDGARIVFNAKRCTYCLKLPTEKSWWEPK